MDESDRDKKKPTRIDSRQSEKTTGATPAHPEQAMKTALDITLQKAREIREKYSEKKNIPKATLRV